MRENVSAWAYREKGLLSEVWNKTMAIALLVIDPQIDFCDPEIGALPVPGAARDMARLARMIVRLAPRLDTVHVTLDTHHLLDVAHPLFWQNNAGEHPAPFTLISTADVEQGRWQARPNDQARALAYVRALDTQGRYTLCIWPPHCLLGSAGHAVMPDVFAALLAWEQEGHIVDYVQKGTNIYTEHYSALRAEVPDRADPSTLLNIRLRDALEQADLIVVAGEAGSHCVANTVRDLADSFADPAYVRKLVLLSDATSAVRGFEAYQQSFLQDLTARGMQVSTTLEFLA